MVTEMSKLGLGKDSKEPGMVNPKPEGPSHSIIPIESLRRSVALLANLERNRRYAVGEILGREVVNKEETTSAKSGADAVTADAENSRTTSPPLPQ